MRTTHRCPKCQGQKLYVCENRQPDWHSSSRVRPLSVAAVELSTEDTGGKEGTAFRTHGGTFETWICAACGFTEWYAQDQQGLLEHLSTRAGSGVRVVESGVGSPFR
jgi:predicted nucleic-acid-binding Zn-ribbon protein